MYSVELCADLGGGRLRPLQLVGLALTNQPNNPGQRPITNSQAAPLNDNTNQQDNNMEELKKSPPSWDCRKTPGWTRYWQHSTP